MNLIDTKLHCPYCGKAFHLELEEHTHEDDLIEECPQCGSPIEVRLVLDTEGEIAGAEAFRADGERNE